MTERERFLACLNYENFDKAPLRIFGAWPETVERWKKEGYQPENPPFTLDRWDWFGHWFFPAPAFEKKVLQEDESTILYINREGILLRERKDNPASSMPQFIRFPVETRQDFRRFWKERMKPDLSQRIGPDWKEKLSTYKKRTVPLIIVADRWGGFFGPLRNLLGLEKLCLLFYDQPSFVEEMMEAEVEFILKIMDQILQYTDIDVFGFWEDMACKNGPLISPCLVKKFMLPRYRKVVDYLAGKGLPFFSLDSDGNISSLIPVWLDAGINILYPFEVQSGMDVCQIRKKYGRSLRMWFGIDKRAAISGPAAIDAEMARVSSLVREGGYVPGPDHSFPPDVSYSNFCYFMEKLQKIL